MFRDARSPHLIYEVLEVARLLSLEARPLLQGGAFVLTSSIVAAFANVYNKKHFPDVPPVWNVWLQTLAGSIFLLILALVFERGAALHWTPRAVATWSTCGSCSRSRPRSWPRG